MKRSALRNRAEYAAAVIAVKSLEWAPLALANLLARFYIWILRVALPRLRRVALRNLSFALPELSSAQHAAIADDTFRSLARVVTAFARFPSIRRQTVDSWIRTEGGQYFEEALRKGRGVLFATAHLGNWELSAFAHALLTGPMSVVVRPLDNPLIDRMVERRRTLSGNRILAKKDYARGILKALAANQAVGVLIDQNATAADGVFVDFFGVAACATTGFVRIAHHSGAAVIPGFALWMEDEQRYVLRFYPPVAITGDAVADTRTLHHKLEEIVREYPGQWLWLHRRWKTRPPGEATLYEAL
jgi:KDO2-lipid IV(A) lauroyltransferase